MLQRRPRRVRKSVPWALSRIRALIVVWRDVQEENMPII